MQKIMGNVCTCSKFSVKCEVNKKDCSSRLFSACLYGELAHRQVLHLTITVCS